MKNSSNFLVLALFLVDLRAQYVPNEFTVKVKPDCRIDTSSDMPEGSVIEWESCHPGSSLYRIRFQNMDEIEQRAWLTKHACIEYFRPATQLNARTKQPNDSAFSQQYAIRNMFINDIWDFNCSGLSTEGDTLAIGVIDYGFDFSIPDLKPNLFYNKHEIPDNRLDDDKNGYVDDYLGFNADAGIGDNHPLDKHGTGVVSVVGARGNNRIGISGVNQQIKIIFCSANTDFELVRCYYYFRTMRSLYAKTGGNQGAFVVSTNCSLGLNEKFPEDYPHVCEVFDSLGKTGILNTLATVNENWDIGQRGDIPALCESDFTIVVTNLDKNNNKVLASGYNKEFVDISANGEKILMYGLGGRLAEDNGTSFAAPHVAGVVALLYQFCPKLTRLAKSNPDSAALLIKSILMDCSTQRPQLQPLTKSGAQLNGLKALTCLHNWCEDSDKAKELLASPNPFSDFIHLKVSSLQFGIYKILIFNSLGQLLYEQPYRHAPDNPSELLIPTHHWPRSMYYLVIEGQEFLRSLAVIKI